MQTNATYPVAGGPDREKLDRQITEVYHSVATDEPDSAPVYACRLGYPPLCAHGMNPLTDRDYALARLRRG